MNGELRQAELKISGMTCAMCTKAVEASLLEKTGVILAQVNLGNETATVQYDPLQVKLADLKLLMVATAPRPKTSKYSRGNDLSPSAA